MNLRSLIFGSLLLPLAVCGGTSTNYTLSPDTVDNGGLLGTSVKYSINFSATPGRIATSAKYSVRMGFAGQLLGSVTAAPIGIEITALPSTVDEVSTRQLEAVLVYNNDTRTSLAASSLTWSVTSGPITSVSTSGLATSAAVYQDTAAVVRGSYQTFNNSLGLTVLDTNLDNYGTYAADGIDDAWQVQYFGLNNPNAGPLLDPDRDGQNNLFEFTSGLLPISGRSMFTIITTSDPGQPSQESIVFGPCFADRTYTVFSSPELDDTDWNPLLGGIITDKGDQRTITDPAATGSFKFYRVEITKP